MDAHNLFFPRGDESLLEGIIMTLLKKSMSKSKKIIKFISDGIFDDFKESF